MRIVANANQRGKRFAENARWMTQTSGAYVHRPPQSSSSSSSLSEPDQDYTELSKGCGKEHSDILSAARL